MARKAMPDVETPPEYSSNLEDSYAFGYTYAKGGHKSMFHEKRLRCTTKWDKGYTQGWKEYTEDKINELLTGETNE